MKVWIIVLVFIAVLVGLFVFLREDSPTGLVAQNSPVKTSPSLNQGNNLASARSARDVLNSAGSSVRIDAWEFSFMVYMTQKGLSSNGPDFSRFLLKLSKQKVF